MDENKMSDEWALETLKTFTASIMETEGEVSPRFIVMCVDAMITVPSLARDDREKDAMAAVVKLVTMATAAYAVAFVGEAWIAAVTDSNKPVRPSEAPDRTEVLLISLEKRDAEGQPMLELSTREILRNPDGSFARLGPERQNSQTQQQTKGRLTGLLTEKPPSAEERQAAAARLGWTADGHPGIVH